MIAVNSCQVRSSADWRRCVTRSAAVQLLPPLDAHTVSGGSSSGGRTSFHFVKSGSIPPGVDQQMPGLGVSEQWESPGNGFRGGEDWSADERSKGGAGREPRRGFCAAQSAAVRGCSLGSPRCEEPGDLCFFQLKQHNDSALHPNQPVLRL